MISQRSSPSPAVDRDPPLLRSAHIARHPPKPRHLHGPDDAVLAPARRLDLRSSKKAKDHCIVCRLFLERDVD